MNWIELKSESQLKELTEKSHGRPQIIFKHSSRCGISSMAKNRLERGTAQDNVDFYFLDLLKYRNLSEKIASSFNVFHESPQILLIKNGDCVYDESHGAIMMNEIEEQIFMQEK